MKFQGKNYECFFFFLVPVGKFNQQKTQERNHQDGFAGAMTLNSHLAGEKNLAEILRIFSTP